MRVAVFSHYFVPEIGAPPARLFETARVWVRAGHQVEVVTGLPSHPFGRLYPGYSRCLRMEEQMEGVRICRHWTYLARNQAFWRRALGHASFWPASQLLSTRRLGKPQITIGSSPTFFAAMAARSAARHFSVPFVMEIRDLWPGIVGQLGFVRSRWLLRQLDQWARSLYRSAARIVSVTRSFSEYLAELGVPPSKLVTIPNGADLDFWKPGDRALARHQLGLNPSEFLVLYIGAHGISQALDVILEAASRLASSNIRFLCIGDGAEKEKLISRARDERLSNLSFLDPVPKESVPSWYAAADLALVPLRNIPLFAKFIPSKIFEILASGVPLVAALTGEAAEIVEASRGGWVVPPADPESLASAIEHLRRHPEMLREMGVAGRQFVAQNYSRSRLAETYLEVLQETIREAGA